MIRSLIFDFDGLILDTETTEFQSWEEIYTAHGCELPRKLWTDAIGRAAGHFDPYAHLEQLVGSPVERTRIRTERHAREAELVAALPVRPGATQYLQDAKRLGLTIGMASSSPHSWVEGHLHRFGLHGYFSVFKCAEDTAKHKPEPDPYLAAVQDLGCFPDEAIAFEDSPNGIRSAKAAGLFCVAVPNPMTRGLSLELADLRLDSLADRSLEQVIADLL